MQFRDAFTINSPIYQVVICLRTLRTSSVVILFSSDRKFVACS